MSNRTKYQDWLNRILFSAGDAFQLNAEGWERAIKRMEARESSWIVKIVSVIGGMMATQFFLGFLLIGGITESPIALSIIGLMLIIGSLFALRKVDLLIADTIAICSYLTGFVLVALAQNLWKVSINQAAVIQLVIALVTLIFIRHTILAFFAFSIVMGCGLFLFFNNSLLTWVQIWPAALSIALVILYEKEAGIVCFLGKMASWYRPLLLVVALVFIGMLQLLGKRHLVDGISEDFSYVSILLLLLFVRLVFQTVPLLDVPDRNQRIIITAVVTSILLPTLISPAIVGILLLLLLSFRSGDRWIWILSLVSLIVFMSEYYYDLYYTLLTKSYILMGTGAGFLLLYFFTRKKWLAHERE
jgi:hypothetical protein